MAKNNLAILVIRRDNIGDLILTTPLFTALRAKYPDAYIAVLVNSYNRPAIEGNPDIDEIFSYTKGKHAQGETLFSAYWRRLKLLWKLRRRHFDYVILPNGGFAARALKLARALAPREIIGFPGEAIESKAITLPIPHAEGGKLHETEDIFRLLAPLGITGEIPGLTLRADQQLAQAYRAQLPDAVRTGQGPLIALHISARKEKQRWPVENFAQLAKQLHQTHQARFLIFWSPGDENNPFHPGDDQKAERLLAQLAGLPVAPITTNSLPELIAGMSLVDYCILSDGGGMHVATGLGKPVVCFFGDSNAIRWHPWGVRYELLQKDSRDVSDISVAEAIAAFTRLLGNHVTA